jgi:hypothetical protein
MATIIPKSIEDAQQAIGARKLARGFDKTDRNTEALEIIADEMTLIRANLTALVSLAVMLGGGAGK